MSAAETPSRDNRRLKLHKEQRRAQIGRAALVGALAGLAGVGFQLAVKAAEGLSFWLAAHELRIVVIAATSIAGLLAAWMTGRYAPEAGGSGIPHIKAVLLHLRSIRTWRLVSVKVGAGLLALGGGMSLGREGPTVQIGASVGKMVGDLFKVPRRSYGPLIAAGSGAGLAAAFNAPLAGFIFVMEELKREMSPITYGTALIASVCSVAVTRVCLGQGASFHLPSPAAPPLIALGPVALLGVLGGAAGVLFNKCLLGAISLREGLKAPRWLAGAVVGAISGILLIYFPEISGGGHEIASQLLLGRVRAEHLLALTLLVFVGKLLFTAASYGTGVPGGIFAPILVMGAFLGYAFGLGVQQLDPSFPFAPAGFATIGMAAVLSSSVRAPLTGVVLIVEMTAEYRLLYALLVGAFLAYAFAEMVGDEPIYEALLERDLHKTGRIASEDDEPIVIEFLIEPDAEMDGRKIKDLEMPEGSLIMSLSRNNRQLVPRGATQVRAGDTLTVILDGDNLMTSLRLHQMAKAPD